MALSSHRFKKYNKCQLAVKNKRTHLAQKWNTKTYSKHITNSWFFLKHIMPLTIESRNSYMYLTLDNIYTYDTHILWISPFYEINRHTHLIQHEALSPKHSHISVEQIIVSQVNYIQILEKKGGICTDPLSIPDWCQNLSHLKSGRRDYS